MVLGDVKNIHSIDRYFGWLSTLGLTFFKTSVSRSHNQAFYRQKSSEFLEHQISIKSTNMTPPPRIRIKAVFVIKSGHDPPLYGLYKTFYT